MFLCVSANPAIDRRIVVPSLRTGRVIRAQSARAYAGGKAAHVAMVLRTLGETPDWIGFCGGASGVELGAGLTQRGITVHPCHSDHPTRTNLEIIDATGTVTEILEPGEAPSPAELEVFENMCRALFSSSGAAAFVVFSGSLPAGTAPAFYAHLISLARQFGCTTLLDAAGEPLRLALVSRPDFVKLNRDEAGSLLGITIDSLAAARLAIQKLIAFGASAASLSLGSDGMLYCASESDPVYFAPAPRLSVRSTVGCGDSALAGFARELSKKASAVDALRLAAACAAANCLADSPGAARSDDIARFAAEIQVRALPIGY
jgi:1-phosphofructokinase family hexose kinase